MRRAARKSVAREEVAPVKLLPCRVRKPWGRRALGEPFGTVAETEEPVGEIWFERVDELPAELLVKYLFTSRDLSVQVHPGAVAARAAGLGSGKDEAWLVLSAEPGAMIGLGLREIISKQELRAAALNGRLPGMMFWHVVQAGSFFYVPAGTIHAIGGGVTLVEIQQNVDVTYRLYDYGRERELHLEEAVAAANPAPYVDATTPHMLEPGREILADGAAFVVERWTGQARRALACDAASPAWLVPIRGASRLNHVAAGPGTAWLAEADITVETAAGAELLLAYPGRAPRETR